jgi:hypothetical protein
LANHRKRRFDSDDTAVPWLVRPGASADIENVTGLPERKKERALNTRISPTKRPVAVSDGVVQVGHSQPASALIHARHQAVIDQIDVLDHALDDDLAHAACVERVMLSTM